jgi:hypothetical protein
LLKTLLITFPPSGRGVTESLALDQAPFTKMTPDGTFVSGCKVLEKSPPFLGALCGLAPWPQADDDIDKARTSKEHENREHIFVLRIQAIRAGEPEESVADHFLNRETAGETPSWLASKSA